MPHKVVTLDSGLEILETECPGRSCDRPYRIDAMHPEYARVKAAVESGDRSILRCYHKVAH